jgi:glycogen(starch) synthase
MFRKLKDYVSKILCWFRLYEVNRTPDTDAEKGQVGVNREESTTPDEDNVKEPWTFEILWDVVANVADLFTINGEKNILIGRYRPDKAADEILHAEFPRDSPLAVAVEAVRDKGFKVITGKWLIRDRPPAIVFHVESARDMFGDRYLEMFKKDHMIDIPADDEEARDAVIFGYMVAEFLTEFELRCRPESSNGSNPTTGLNPSLSDTKQPSHQDEPTEPSIVPSDIEREPSGNEICTQFHDWKCAVGLVLLRQWSSRITTIFTLKTSCLEGDFHSQERAHEEARRRGIFHRFSMELAAALASNIFTPISETVAEQAEVVLGKHPDCVITQD